MGWWRGGRKKGRGRGCRSYMFTLENFAHGLQTIDVLNRQLSDWNRLRKGKGVREVYRWGGREDVEKEEEGADIGRSNCEGHEGSVEGNAAVQVVGVQVVSWRADAADGTVF